MRTVQRATFDGPAVYRLARVDDDADFVDARFGATVVFDEVEFPGVSTSRSGLATCCWVL